jgi:hypothetical protein
MIYEKRTYTINPLKMADWLALYKAMLTPCKPSTSVS